MISFASILFIVNIITSKIKFQKILITIINVSLVLLFFKQNTVIKSFLLFEIILLMSWLIVLYNQRKIYQIGVYYLSSICIGSMIFIICDASDLYFIQLFDSNFNNYINYYNIKNIVSIASLILCISISPFTKWITFGISNLFLFNYINTWILSSSLCLILIAKFYLIANNVNIINIIGSCISLYGTIVLFFEKSLSKSMIDISIIFFGQMMILLSNNYIAMSHNMYMNYIIFWFLINTFLGSISDILFTEKYKILYSKKNFNKHFILNKLNVVLFAILLLLILLLLLIINNNNDFVLKLFNIKIKNSEISHTLVLLFYYIQIILMSIFVIKMYRMLSILIISKGIKSFEYYFFVKIIQYTFYFIAIYVILINKKYFNDLYVLKIFNIFQFNIYTENFFIFIFIIILFYSIDMLKVNKKYDNEINIETINNIDLINYEINHLEMVSTFEKIIILFIKFFQLIIKYSYIAINRLFFVLKIKLNIFIVKIREIDINAIVSNDIIILFFLLQIIVLLLVECIIKK